MLKIPRKVIILLFILSLIVLGAVLMKDTVVRWFFSPTNSSLPVGIENSSQLESASNNLETIAENLVVPWDIARLPGGDILFTERSGNLKRIGQTTIDYTIPEVTETSEGGLLGLALDPDFENNNHLYLYMTVNKDSGLENQIVRYSYTDNNLQDKTVILDDIPGANTHDGGKIAFGPDGFLYATTGDANDPESAQDTSSLAGKIIRISKDGSIPADNPFNNAIYSYGHRNSQGITWDNQEQLWATEHGRSGAQSGYDELNLIVKGGNYGWPIIQGDDTQADMISPVVHSGPDETWAPGGIAFSDGELFFTGLRGRRLYQATISQDGKSATIQTHFVNEFGRLRAASIIDEYLYLGTSNRDGRGQPDDSDDRIIRIPLSIFN